MTDSLGNFSDYTSELIGGTWVPVNSEGSGCSSCTLRGAISYTYDTQGNRLSATNGLGETETYTYDALGRMISQTISPSTAIGTR